MPPLASPECLTWILVWFILDSLVWFIPDSWFISDSWCSLCLTAGLSQIPGLSLTCGLSQIPGVVYPWLLVYSRFPVYPGFLVFQIPGLSLTAGYSLIYRRFLVYPGLLVYSKFPGVVYPRFPGVVYSWLLVYSGFLVYPWLLVYPDSWFTLVYPWFIPDSWFIPDLWFILVYPDSWFILVYPWFISDSWFICIPGLSQISWCGLSLVWFILTPASQVGFNPGFPPLSPLSDASACPGGALGLFDKFLCFSLPFLSFFPFSPSIPGAASEATPSPGTVPGGNRHGGSQACQLSCQLSRKVH